MMYDNGLYRRQKVPLVSADPPLKAKRELGDKTTHFYQSSAILKFTPLLPATFVAQGICENSVNTMRTVVD